MNRKSKTIAMMAAATIIGCDLATAKPPTPTPTPTPKPTATPTPAPTPVPIQTFAAGFEATVYRGGGQVIKSSPGSVLTVVGTSDNDVFVLLFDKATAPVPGDIPVLAVQPETRCVSDGAKVQFNYTGQGLPFSNGISWAVSTSPVVLQQATNNYNTQITVTFEDFSTPTRRFSSTASGVFPNGYQPAGEVAKASPGTVLTASVTSYNMGEAFVLFFDKATPPVNGDVPVLAIDTWSNPNTQCPARSRFANYADTPLRFANGIGWAISSSPAILAPFSTVSIEAQVTVTYQ